MKNIFKKSIMMMLCTCMIISTSSFGVVSASNSIEVTGSDLKIVLNVNTSLWVNSYKINESNYVKLRDLAVVLNGTVNQFALGYDASSSMITLTTGQPYQFVGGEMVLSPEVKASAVPKTLNLSVDRKVTTLEGYIIDNNAYVTVEDLSSVLGYAYTMSRTRPMGSKPASTYYAVSTFDEDNVVIPGIISFGDFSMVPRDVIEPVKAFDNLYFIGSGYVGCYMIPTSEGIIMIDSMNSEEDFINIIGPSMAKVGLDPKDIKILLVSHGHGDHYGSAKYVQETYGAKVYISKLDEQLIKNSISKPDYPFGPGPDSYDGYLTDFGTITLGDETITSYATPGHTDGTMSFTIPVYDNGVAHTMCIWGGTGLNTNLESMKTYVDSATKFAKICADLHVDSSLSAHPFADYSLDRIAALRIRKEGEPNPMIQGEEAVQTMCYGLRQAAQNAVVELQKSNTK